MMMTLTEFIANIDVGQQKTLAGGITCKGLKIIEVSKTELRISGVVTITLKVWDLTKSGNAKLDRLMSSTQKLITSKLTGPSSAKEVFLQKYDAKKNSFDGRGAAFYSLKYDITYLVKVQEITMVTQLQENDFVLAVVDYIAYNNYKGNGTRGLTVGTGGPATVSYSEWVRDPVIGTHEFFHTLDLDDIENKKQENRLMYNKGDRSGKVITENERSRMNSYLMTKLELMARGSYSNPSLNTVVRLRNFLKNPTYGFQYNKAKLK